MLYDRELFEKLLYDQIDLYDSEEVEEALKLFNLALDGDNEAMLEIAFIYRMMDKYSDSVHWLKEAAILENTTAMYELGNCYFEGLG